MIITRTVKYLLLVCTTSDADPQTQPSPGPLISPRVRLLAQQTFRPSFMLSFLASAISLRRATGLTHRLLGDALEEQYRFLL